MDLRIKIILGGICLFICGAVHAYEINGNTVTQTPNGGTKIKLANPMRVDLPQAKDNIPEYFSKPPRKEVALIGWEILSNPNNINVSPYLIDLTNDIYKNLPKIDNLPEGQIKVNFTIQKNGKLLDLEVVKNPYDKSVEEKVLNAISSVEGNPFNERNFKPIKICITILIINKSNQEKMAFTEPDFGPYMRELQRRIKMNWDPPKDNSTKRITVLMRVTKDGGLEKCSIFQSSGNTKADKAALDAVYKTAPFRPLPAEYSGKSIDIQFTFDYNVFRPLR